MNEAIARIVLHVVIDVLGAWALAVALLVVSWAAYARIFTWWTERSRPRCLVCTAPLTADDAYSGRRRCAGCRQATRQAHEWCRTHPVRRRQ